MGIITVSRTHGSGGTIIARELAKHLDYSFINRTIINNDCRENSDRICMFGIGDEGLPESRESIEELMSNVDFYKVSMVADILDRALNNNAIFAGMGTGIIFSGLLNTLNIRVVRLLEERVKAIAGVKDIPYDDAFDLVEKMDESKRDYIAAHFNTNIDDPSLYHLVINSSHVPMDDAIDIVTSYARKHFTPSHPKETETVLKDRLLEKRAEIILFRLGMAHSYGNVKFSASGDGILSVTGILRNEAEKNLLLHTLGKNKNITRIEESLETGISPTGN